MITTLAIKNGVSMVIELRWRYFIPLQTLSALRGTDPLGIEKYVDWVSLQYSVIPKHYLISSHLLT
jgi:hypothetical protein